jgi:steroid 5-alpha reductase family enzyme
MTPLPASTVFLATLAITLLAFLLLWLLSLRLGDASIVDICWGLGFTQIAITAGVLGGGYPWRKLLVTGLTVLWGLRLAGYLLWRNAGHGEDFRYQAMRRRHGARFWIVSLYMVFGLQAGLMWIVSLPVQVAQLAPTPDHLTGLDAAGALLWALGFAFESVGDLQLARFKADPANQGRVMDGGLWRYTRHPNYFGDACVWWGLFLIALATPHGTWTVVGPALMTLFLMRVSGVALLERKLVKSRPEYQDYIRRTSAFVPWRPKRRIDA